MSQAKIIPDFTYRECNHVRMYYSISVGPLALHWWVQSTAASLSPVVGTVTCSVPLPCTGE